MIKNIFSIILALRLFVSKSIHALQNKLSDIVNILQYFSVFDTISTDAIFYFHT